MSSGFPPPLIASVFWGTFGGYFGGLFGGYFGGSLQVKDTENGSPTFLAHPIPPNLGECAQDFFSDCGKPQLPAGDSNLWETMCPLSPSSKTPLYWNTPIRKSIHKVAALFVLPLLISPSLPPCSSLLPLFICFGGDWVSWRIFSKGDGMTSLTQSFLFFSGKRWRCCCLCSGMALRPSELIKLSKQLWHSSRSSYRRSETRDEVEMGLSQKYWPFIISLKYQILKRGFLTT